MFQILYHEELLGTSALENGDPPMGCAEGVFTPDEAFSDFRTNVAPQTDNDPTINRWVGLTVRTEHGASVECLDVVLLEWSLGGHKELRIDVLGIPYPRYEELFPGRYAAYEASLHQDKI